MTGSDPTRAHPRRLLLLAIHDVSPRFAGEVARLADRLDAQVGAGRYAMLVVPDHWGGAPLRADPAFVRALRRWGDLGVEMFVHGYVHRDDRHHVAAADRWRARVMTAGEGEFLGLDHAEAARRIALGRAVIEDATGRPVAGFVAPAWLYGPGARTALTAAGLPLAEDHFRVWDPRDGRVLARGPVITWATRTRPRELSSLAFAALARRALRPLPVVRIGVHPGDCGSNAVMTSIGRTVEALGRGRTIGRYAQLAAAERPTGRG